MCNRALFLSASHFIRNPRIEYETQFKQDKKIQNKSEEEEDYIKPSRHTNQFDSETFNRTELKHKKYYESEYQIDGDYTRHKNNTHYDQKELRNNSEPQTFTRGLDHNSKTFTDQKQHRYEAVSFPQNSEDLSYQKERKSTTNLKKNVKPAMIGDDSITETYISGDLLQEEKAFLEPRKKVKYSPIENKARIYKPRLPEDFKGEEVLFGLHPVRLALSSKRRVFHRIYMKHTDIDREHNDKVAEIESLAVRANVPIEKASTGFLSNISGGRPHQGVCMNVGPLKLEPYVEGKRELETCSDPLPPLWLAVDRVCDPMNFGAVLRSAHFLGANKVLCVEEGNCPLTPVVSKASSGAMEVMKIFRIRNLVQFLKEKQSSGWAVLGTDGWTGSTTFGENSKFVEINRFKMDRPSILLVGNEGQGVTEEVLSLCDKVLVISPSSLVHDGVHSLNVSVATGIVLHSLLVGRKQED